MAENGQGSTEVVEFDTLDVEGNGTSEGAEKINALMKLLKEKLDDADYKEAAKILGVRTDLSNEELLGEIAKLLAKKKDKEYPEEEDMSAYTEFIGKCRKGGKSLKECADEWKEKHPKSQAALEMASYKDFMGKCMKGGKSLKECADEWKEKYPEPKKEEISEVEELAAELAKKKKDEEEEEYPEPVKKRMEQLEGRIKELEKEAEDAKVSTTIQGLITERHLAPIQRDSVFKLSSNMDPEMREEFFNFFRTTQKFKVSEDVGQIQSGKPGSGDDELTPERRAELMRKHGIDQLIEDKGVKPRNH